MLKRLRLSRRRRKLAAAATHPDAARLLATPLPDAARPWRSVRYVALDLETTGLDPARDSIIAAGWVPVEGGRVRPGQGGYCLVQPDGGVGQSATVHGLTDTNVREGKTPLAAFEALIDALENSVMIVHHAPLDVGMLNRLSRSLANVPFDVPVIDTLAMARARLQRQGKPVTGGALRLETVRESFGLPRYGAHHGLTDAIATAELFIALVQKRFGDDATFGRVWP